jgi:hypothetical protein
MTLPFGSRHDSFTVSVTGVATAGARTVCESGHVSGAKDQSHVTTGKGVLFSRLSQALEISQSDSLGLPGPGPGRTLAAGPHCSVQNFSIQVTTVTPLDSLFWPYYWRGSETHTVLVGRIAGA